MALITIGVIPMPDHQRAAGVVESAQRSGVFFAVDGFVETAHVHAGDRVRKGDHVRTTTGDENAEAFHC